MGGLKTAATDSQEFYAFWVEVTTCYVLVGNLLNGVAATMDTKTAPDLPSISCYIRVSAFLNWFNVLQSIVLHVYVFVSQE